LFAIVNVLQIIGSSGGGGGGGGRWSVLYVLSTPNNALCIAVTNNGDKNCVTPFDSDMRLRK
jgi:hypothetical protein